MNLSKGLVMFAPVAYLQETLRELDANFARHTPCAGMTKERLISAIACTHAELVQAHPFREGNGRLARWVADLMVLQAGMPLLEWDFERNADARREEYFAALRRGFLMDFSPLETLIHDALDRAIHSAEDPGAGS